LEKRKNHRAPQQVPEGSKNIEGFFKFTCIWSIAKFGEVKPLKPAEKQDLEAFMLQPVLNEMVNRA
jgi:hypothetical protein